MKKFISNFTTNKINSSIISTKRFIKSKDREAIIKLREISKRSINKQLLPNIINLISCVDLLVLASEKIQSYRFTTDLDKIDLEWFRSTSILIKSGKYKFSIAKPIIILNNNNKISKFLKCANFKEKIVLKAILLVLQAIYEPHFHLNSHGSRLFKGNHTAFFDIKKNFKSVNWILETDILNFFNSMDHVILLDTIKEKIQCTKTIALIRKFLSCSFSSNGTIFHPKKGVLERNMLTQILCNIYLIPLDNYLSQFNFQFASVNPYKKKHLYFVRYHENFFIGISGDFNEILLLKNLLQKFLNEKLKMTLNLVKTKIIFFSSNTAFFLGTFIKKTFKNKKVSFHVPIKILFEKATLKGIFKKKNFQYIPISKKNLVNFSHSDIITFYNKIIKSTLSYYSFVDNKKSLGSFVYGLKMSCARTLALKYKSRSVTSIFIKYGRKLECPISNNAIFIPLTFAVDHKFLIDEIPFEKIIDKNWYK